MSNCLVSAANFGSRRLTVTEINHGINVVPGDTQNTRNASWFFSKIVSSGSFEMSVTCTSYQSYLETARWFESYTKQKSDPVRGARIGTMRVQIANVNFDAEPVIPFEKWGIPKSGITFGDEAGKFVYKMTIGFEGTSDASGAYNPYAPPPSEDDPTSEAFYPWPIAARPDNLASSFSIEDTVYGSPLVNMNVINGLG